MNRLCLLGHVLRNQLLALDKDFAQRPDVSYHPRLIKRTPFHRLTQEYAVAKWNESEREDNDELCEIGKSLQ
jgi:hypothetical protein